jgi:glycosyltransferase involved in cell wall biosynthesis
LSSIPLIYTEVKLSLIYYMKMKLALILFLVSILVESCLWLKPTWGIRKYWASLTVFLVSISTGLYFGKQPDVWTGLVLTLSVYRVINLLRLVEGRTKPDFLYKVAVKSSAWLILFQLILIGVRAISKQLKLRAVFWNALLQFIIFISICFLIYSLRRHMAKTLPKETKGHVAARDLPTLSVLIPARNETVDLEECLESLLQNNYPKLEILVLDDCSQNKRTPDIIKQFAHDGAEFVEGGLPPEDWLAKNYAYEQLQSKANGELLLFCGVDVRFSEHTLTSLVEQLIERNKQMISVMPDNQLRRKLNPLSFMLQPLRYAWEMIPPRRMLNRPPVLSSCWLIKSDRLKKLGGFEAVKRSASPESYFAKSCIAKDGYSFVRSNGKFGLFSQKSWREKIDTAIRTRYPQTHRRPELVAALSLLEVSLFILPLALLVVDICDKLWPEFAISFLSLIGVLYISQEILRLTYQGINLFYSRIAFIAVVLDVALLNYSMWQYEFNEVIWKGRNVCLPLSYSSNYIQPTQTKTNLN